MRRLPLRSPPRMRGKVIVRSRNAVQIGITPACAGKRHCPRFRPGKTRDHPRVCGEKSSLMQMDVGPLGSPPRMRGKGELPKDTKDYFGITPAYAGKRMLYARAVRRDRDHPRVCGEKYYVTVGKADHEGSPPRMRGKVRAAPLGAGDAGITPACAGKRSARSAACLAGKDHPRVCGEKLHSLSPQLCVHGSPPRVRGKGCCGVGIPLDCGITPACAGKSITLL